MKHCSKCNSKLNKKTRFCPECGEYIVVEEHDLGQRNKKKKRISIIALGIALLVVLSAVACILLFPKKFSQDTKAMAKAEESVVKIYCYDSAGQEVATGSGFIAFENNLCITNYHVLTEAYSIKISSSEDRTFAVEGTLVYSEEKDIAILKLKEAAFKPLSLGDSDEIKKGETVTAIGSPLGIKNTISQGVLSGRIMQGNMDILQVSAPISSGSSGGALFDESGNVVGVTFASFTEGQNLNLAIPINEVIALYTENKDNNLKESNCIFLECNPEYKYIHQYEQVETVSIRDLQENPSAYNGKMVKIVAYATAKTTWLYVSDYIAINNTYNVYESKNFEDLSCLQVINGYECEYEENDIQSGNLIIIVGKFVYQPIGSNYIGVSNNELVTLTRTTSYATLRAHLIYKAE